MLHKETEELTEELKKMPHVDLPQHDENKEITVEPSPLKKVDEEPPVEIIPESADPVEEKVDEEIDERKEEYVTSTTFKFSKKTEEIKSQNEFIEIIIA